MQFTTVALFASLAVATPLVLSQTPAGLPICAKACFDNNVAGTSCAGSEDLVCLCASKSYNQAVLSCVSTSSGCTPADQLTTLSWAQNTCNSVGVPINL